VTLLGALCVVYLYPFPYFEHLNNPNENVRLYQARALVEDGSLTIGRRSVRAGGIVDHGGPVERHGPVNDKALVCEDGGRPPKCSGRLYPAKAPATSFVAALPVALTNALAALLWGKAPSTAVTIRICRLLCSVFPTLLLLWALRRYLRRTLDAPWVADVVCVATGLATVGYTYGLQLTGHQQAAVALGLGFFALERARQQGGRGWLVLGGVLLGAGPAFEYPAALAAAGLGGYVLAAPTLRRRIGWIVLGAGVPLAGLALYHWAAFGHPLSTPYDHMENISFARDMSAGFHGVGVPRLRSFLGMLLGPPAGLLFHAPWLVLALPGAVALARRRRWPTLIAVAGVALGAVYFASSMPTWRVMLGWTHGPRYLCFAVPFVAIGAAWGVRWCSGLHWIARGATLGLVLAAVAMTALPTVVFPFSPPMFSNPVFQMHLPLLSKGLVARNAGQALGLTGPLSLLPWGAAVALACLLAGRVSPAAPGDKPGLRWLAAVVVAGGLVAGLALPFRAPSKRRAGFVRWAVERWEPHPGGAARERPVEGSGPSAP